MVPECNCPGADVIAISQHHDISCGQLWRWRQEARLGRLTVTSQSGFLPLQIIAEPPTSPTAAVHAAAPDDRIEIMLTDGTTIRIGSNIGAVALRRMLGVLRG